MTDQPTPADDLLGRLADHLERHCQRGRRRVEARRVMTELHIPDEAVNTAILTLTDYLRPADQMDAGLAVLRNAGPAPAARRRRSTGPVPGLPGDRRRMVRRRPSGARVRTRRTRRRPARQPPGSTAGRLTPRGDQHRDRRRRGLLDRSRRRRRIRHGEGSEDRRRARHPPRGAGMSPPQEDHLPGCRLCGDSEPRSPQQILDHFRVVHPDVYGDGPERWPDGALVVEFEPSTPADIIDFGTPQ